MLVVCATIFVKYKYLYIIVQYKGRRKMDFDAERATKETVEWIRAWFEKNGPGCNAIIGISGGKDSSIASALCVEALGKDRVIGVLMPNGEQNDFDMAMLLVDHLGIEHYVVNISDGFNGLKDQIESAGISLSKDSIINLAPRLRMSTLYAVGQSRNGRIINTCNMSEDWVGYSTRYGDSAGDMSPLSCFTTAEIRAIGRELGVPSVLVEKVPTDGLSGMSDEEKLGFSYEVLDRYIRTGQIDDPAVKARIDALHEKNLFKLKYMDCFEYKA